MELDIIHNQDCLEGMRRMPAGCVDVNFESGQKIRQTNNAEIL